MQKQKFKGEKININKQKIAQQIYQKEQILDQLARYNFEPKPEIIRLEKRFCE